MAWNIKYRSSFMSESGILYDIEILEENYTDPVVELNAGVSPFTITSPESSLYNNVTGTGATITFISAEPLQLVDLYAEERHKYLVRLTYDSGNKTQWSGWVDTETYEEVYSEFKNYNITITANDGIALLDAYDYLDVAGEKYTGMNTIHEVISRILLKTKLDVNGNLFHYLYDIHIEEKNGSLKPQSTNNTLLHQIVVNNANYYDELDKPLTCRTVLEEVLKPLGLYLRTNLFLDGQSNTIVGYTIFDNNAIAGTKTLTGYSYTLNGMYDSGFPYITTEYTHDIENELEYKGTGSSMTIGNQVNNQRIVYSPYAIADVLGAKLVRDDFCEYQECANHIQTIPHDEAACPADQKWSELYYDTNPNFEVVPGLANITAIAQGIQGNATYPLSENSDYFMRTILSNSGSGDVVFSTTVDTERIWGHHYKVDNDFYNWALLVDWEMYMRKGPCYENADHTNQFNVYHKFRIEIGGTGYDIDANYFWKTDDPVTLNKWVHPRSSNESILNSVHEEATDGVLVKLNPDQMNNVLNGEVKISMYRYTNISSPETIEHRFKNFSVKLVRDLADQSLYVDYEKFDSTDIVIESEINENVRNEGEDINTIHGTRAVNGGLEKGVLMYNGLNGNGYFQLNNLDKNLVNGTGDPIRSTCEQWLINKVMSNYNRPVITLSNMKLKASDIKNSCLSVLTDTNQFTMSKFMMNGLEYDVYSDLVTVAMSEVSKDDINTTKDTV